MALRRPFKPALAFMALLAVLTPRGAASQYPIVDLPEPLDVSPRAGSLQIDLGRGPVDVFLPLSYDPGIPAPLVILLHGYTNTGGEVEGYLRFLDVIDQYGFLYAHPDGTDDAFGNPFWNATDACCNFFGSQVDDSQYLLDLVNEISAQLNVDERRIYFAGHSNGGFMSYRMACDHPDVVAAVASLAGATFDDPNDCSPPEPVHVLQIHGTSDDVIQYGGGEILGNPYPGAVETVEEWAGFDGCSLIPDGSAPPIDLDTSIPGDETTVFRYETGCAEGGSSELWSIAGGAHSPNVSATFAPLVMDYLYAHPKPGTAGIGMDVALRFALNGIPNPFSGSMEIRFSLPEPAFVTVDVTSVEGRRVRSLVDGETYGVGAHRVSWDGTSRRGRAAPDGVYFIRLAAGGEELVRKVVRRR